jgi:hypothetical protein
MTRKLHMGGTETFYLYSSRGKRSRKGSDAHAGDTGVAPLCWRAPPKNLDPGPHAIGVHVHERHGYPAGACLIGPHMTAGVASSPWVIVFPSAVLMNLSARQGARRQGGLQ